MSDKKLSIPKSRSWEMFNQISSRYDLLNRILSLGFDIGWRKRLAQLLPQKNKLRLLDLATGTADVIITLVQQRPDITNALGIDMAQKMLDVGQSKIVRLGLDERIQLQCADAQALPLEDRSVDVATIAFGIRNIPALNKGLMEMYRVLDDDGRVFILEFSMPPNPVIRFFHVAYLRIVVPVVGFLLSGNYQAYKYLNQTIESFPYGVQFCRIMNQVGFTDVRQHLLLFGAATIYEGRKSVS